MKPLPGNSSVPCVAIVNRNVKDFIVLGDTVYFTGTLSSGTGYYGWFSLNDVINYSPLSPGLIKYKRFNINSTYRFRDMDCIKAYFYQGIRYILLIGNRITMATGEVSRCLFEDKTYTGASCTYATGGGDYFDDIVILNDYVVSVARKGDGSMQHTPIYIRRYNKSNSITDFNLIRLYDWSVIEAVGRIRAQETGNNRFSIAYGWEGNGYVVSCFRIPVSTLILDKIYRTQNITAQCNIKDVGYRSGDSTLLVMHGQTGTYSAFVTEWPRTMFPNTFATSLVRREIQPQGFSVTKDGLNRFAASILKNNNLHLLRVSNSTTSYTCMPQDAISNIELNYSISDHDQRVDRQNCTIRYESSELIVYKTPYSTICGPGIDKDE